MTGAAAAVIVLGPLLLAAAPARPPPDFVLDCYVTQSTAIGLGQFVRHLRVHPGRGVVSVSDGIGGRAPRFIGDGRLVTLGAARLVYEFASSTSSGRTEIDRLSGAFTYSDGRTVISGTCQEGGM